MADLNEEYLKLDRKSEDLQTSEARIARCNEIIATTPSERLNSTYLEKMADYILDAAIKEEKVTPREILVPNRLLTVNKHETSYEGLVGKLENGEDGIYNMMREDKNMIFQPKDPITAEDRSSIPELDELCKAIEQVESQSKKARGKDAYILKKQLIQMRQDQYVIRSAYRKQIYCVNLIKSISKIDLSENITVTPSGEVISDGPLSFYQEGHISLILNYYPKLKMEAWERLDSDIKWLMEDFDALAVRALSSNPLLYRLLIYKIDGKTNAEIQDLLLIEFGTTHSVEYLSSLWCNKIPKLIADQARKDYLDWYYTFRARGNWKKCSRCGEIKLAHGYYFSRNKTSKDGFYSICKCCRNGSNK